MRYQNIEALGRAAIIVPRGPTAVILCENAFLARETANWLVKMGAGRVLALGAVGDVFDDDPRIDAIRADIGVAQARAAQLNAVIARTSGWMLVCFNGEFPFFPHMETRRLADFTDFMAAERRVSVMAYTIDLYSDALGRDDEAFTLDETYFDTIGWYGFERGERQVDVYGGLGWRFEEYTPIDMYRVNRPALFMGGAGGAAGHDVTVGPDLWLNETEANAVSCPWHHNPTMAIMSVRRARALRGHPKFSGAITTFMWPNSERFTWRTDQLVRHGLIELGQWL